MDLFVKLVKLETCLHAPSIRTDRGQIEKLLHPDFKEFGQSGKPYCRGEVLNKLLSEENHAEIFSDGYCLTSLSDDCKLLTYQSAYSNPDGSKTGITLRSSIWKLHEGEWKMLFHQGTAVT